jgi:hypothetical protein
MKLNRSLGLLLASTAFASVASYAFALDGNDVLAKMNALTSPSGFQLAAEGTSVDGDTVTLTGVTATITTADNKKIPLGDVTLEGVTESEDGYDVKKVSFADLNVMDNGSGISATDIYVEGLSIPSEPQSGTLSSIMLADSVHVGSTKIMADNKQVMTLDGVDANYNVADDESKVDFDATISGINIDTTSAPDPKAQETIQALGLQNISGEIGMKGSWTLADGKMDITEYSFDFDNIGRLDINFSLSGYTLAFLKNMQDAVKASQANPDKAAAQAALGMSMMGMMQQLVYNGASIRFDDAGITAKMLDYAGKQQGVDGKQFAQSLKGMLPMVLGGLKMPDLQKQISDAANTYLDDPKSIEVSAKPAQGMPFPQIMGAAMGNPADLAKTLNVQVTANQ